MQDQPADVLDSIYFVFERINSGGIRLSPQEIRNCISAGPFTNMIKRLNSDESWRKVFGGPINKRAKDEELLVRFFAMYDGRADYARPMAAFLNNYSDKMNKAPLDKLETLSSLFHSTIELIDRAVNGRAFRPVRTLNAAVFDSVMPGLAARIQAGPMPEPDAVARAYDGLMASADYRKYWERATADEETVKKRMELATAAFANI
ncbi:MAG: hypothetical protein EOO38_20080 [Cytophagaceae bacterium]|nr:MAG: hypothetical protein EOO38_20080 [Cytophagaceae bacterium]